MDSITVIVHLYNPVEDIIVGNNNDLTVQINNVENTVEITLLTIMKARKIIMKLDLMDVTNLIR